MTYSASIVDLRATCVDTILKGAKPPDLPGEQPTRFELVVNGRTAAVPGITPPPGIRVRADEIRE